MPQCRPRIIPVPARQLDQFIQDPGLHSPRSPLASQGPLLHHCLSLLHCQLHRNWRTRYRKPAFDATPKRRKSNEATYMATRKFSMSQRAPWHQHGADSSLRMIR